MTDKTDALLPFSAKIWGCKIGECSPSLLPKGADLLMRKAIARAYEDLTGCEPDFIFSGWGGELTEGERAVVENRPVCPQPPAPQDDLVEAWREAREAWRSGPGCQLAEEGYLRLGDEPAAVAVLAAFMAPSIAERDAALAKLAEAGKNWAESLAEVNTDLFATKAKLAASEASLDEAITTIAAVRAAATSDDWADSASHFYNLCGETLRGAALATEKNDGK